jgi:polyphosphate kinase 2 (PPK2 family)
VIFNRSHYEEVLVVRVHNLVPPEDWQRHYRQIREFERMLAEEGVTILKFFLHISKDEQKKRLLERIDTPAKNWKFNPGDLAERKFWDAYMQAYEEALSETSADEAPWYIVPANHNWYRDLAIASILVKTLKDLNMQYPKPAEDIQKYRPGLEAE